MTIIQFTLEYDSLLLFSYLSTYLKKNNSIIPLVISFEAHKDICKKGIYQHKGGQ